MKLLSQLTYSAIALIITANLSQSVGLGTACAGDVRDKIPYLSIRLPVLLLTTSALINFPRATLENASLSAEIDKSPFLPIATVVSPFFYHISDANISSKRGGAGWEMSLPLQARAWLKAEMIGVCCGYVRCKEKNTGFNCMTEGDCSGSTDQGYVPVPSKGHPLTPSPTLLLPPHNDEPITERDKPIKNHSGVCPAGSKCCIHLRGDIPSPELAADNSFSSFPADTVAENPIIDNPSPAEDYSQNQNWGYLGSAGTQQVGGVNQQPEAVAAIANEGLWNDVPLA